jgi:hypothetical protein
MSKLNSKKNIVVGLLALLCAGTMLAGCDDIVATPTSSFYDEKILAADGITNNTMSRIYDAIVTEGDTNSEKVLNNVLRIYSESVFGSFYGDDGLYAIVKAGDATKLQAFADKYSVYGGNVKKVMDFYYHVVDSVEEKFLSYVKDSANQERSVFHEKKFYDTQVKAFYKLLDVSNYKVRQVVGDIRLSNHTTGSTDPLNDYFTDLFATYETYIDDQLLPEIYRAELVSQYLYTENYLALGNSYGRNVDFIKLTENAKHADAVNNLLEAYCDLVIAKGEDMSVYGFPFLANMYKGTVSGFTANQSTMATKIYTQAQWTKGSYTYDDAGVTMPRTDVYEETLLGADLDQYQMIYNAKSREDYAKVTDMVKTFTNSNAYPALTGLHIMEKTLIAQSETTTGWYTNGTLDAIPSDYSKRLFKGTTASGTYGVDNGTWDETAKKYKDTDLSKITETTYGAYVGGNYYLLAKNPQTGYKYPYIIKDGTNFYLVMVKEAVNSSKLSLVDSKNSYDSMASHANDELYAGIYKEHIARQVAYNMSTTDTYKASSNQHWVEKMAINYHDTTVYNYFLKTFPDLFD